MWKILCLLLLSVLLGVTPVWAVSYEEASDLLMDRRYAQKLQASGRYEEALSLARRVLTRSRQLFGNQHRELSMSLDTVASILRKMGLYAESEQYFQQALQVARSQRQEQPHDYAASLQNLAGLYRETGRYREGEQLYLEAIRTLKSMEPKDEEAILSISGNLAMLYQDQGRYSEAEPFLKAEYEWALKAAEPDNLSLRMNISMDNKRLFLAERMSNLAGLYLRMKRQDEALELTSAALVMKRRILGDNDPRVAREMNNLGMIYRDAGREPEAEPLLRQAIVTARKIYGDRHPELATYLDNLALLYQRAGRYRDAEQLNRQAVAIDEAALGLSHPTTAMHRNNLAVNLLMQDKFSEAEKMLRSLLVDSQTGQGDQHPETSTRLINLSSALMQQGQHLEANRLFARAIKISERKRDDLFLLLTEQQKLNYLQDEMQKIRMYLVHSLQILPRDPGAAGDALAIWLRWKGIVMEAQGRYLEAIYKTDDPDLKKRFDELVAIRRELAGLRLVQPNPASVISHRAGIELLEHRKEILEAELVKKSASYARGGSSASFGIRQLQQLLPEGTAYIDFALVEDWSFKPLGWNSRRYLAFVVRKSPAENVQLIDLGAAEPIDQAVAGYRQQIVAKASGDQSRASVQINAVAADLYRRLIAPLAPHLKGVDTLVVSPDGPLHLLPFEVLRDDRDSSYLLERYAVRYLTSGRDMVRYAEKSPQTGEVLILADPDYDLRTSASNSAAESGGMIERLKSVHFSRLPDTRVEADAIARLMQGAAQGQVRNLTGSRADESTLFAQSRPRILHLATHGYFLQDETTGGAATRGLKVKQLLRNDPLQRSTNLINPMLRSGIALAGVNRSIAQGRDEGLVSAEKILGLRLLGTDLVTLSACETGVGDLRDGEGVFGLKRAFILAGARTLVLSLWSVPSRETTELMTEFYRQMAAGVSKATALRQAQLKLMRKYPHPFYWGAFQLVGSPD